MGRKAKEDEGGKGRRRRSASFPSSKAQLHSQGLKGRRVHQLPSQRALRPSLQELISLRKRMESSSQISFTPSFLFDLELLLLPPTTHPFSIPSPSPLHHPGPHIYPSSNLHQARAPLNDLSLRRRPLPTDLLPRPPPASHLQPLLPSSSSHPPATEYRWTHALRRHSVVPDLLLESNQGSLVGLDSLRLLEARSDRSGSNLRVLVVAEGTRKKSLDEHGDV